MGQVIAMPSSNQRRSVTNSAPMPERFSRHDQLELLVWASRKGFTAEELAFGIESVRAWWETRRQQRTDWPRVVQRAMREGWGLRGFDKEQKRLGRERRTRITAEWLEAWKGRNPE